MDSGLVIVFPLVLTCIVYLVYHRQQSLHLPPGPKPKLITGNLHQLTPVQPWKLYLKWAERYGSPLIAYRILFQRIVVITKVKAALELLEARSNIYSARPVLWMMGELIGRKISIFQISPHHPRFKVYRKLLHSTLNPRALENYMPLLEQERQNLLESFNNAPEEFMKHIRRNAGALILSIAYGWEVKDNDDYFVSLMEELFALSVEIHKPGRWLVDTFPILRFIPSWFPGAGFKRSAEKYREHFGRIEVIPFAWAKKQIASGSFRDSFTYQHLHRDDDEMVGPEEEEIVQWGASAIYTGGADTTVSALASFVLLMSLHPDIQRRAQAEIEAVVGKDRLPSLSDQASLPYVVAVLKEVLRYAPPAPMGLAHRVEQDDTYHGYYIPKDAFILSDIWALARDPEEYPDPEVFNPDRFFSEKGEQVQMDPRKLVFGFGRRVCPGASFAEASLFFNMSGILASFDIRKPLDENGNEIDPVVEYTTAVTSHPKPFQCRFVPRS